MSVTRIYEAPRVTKPYTEEQWAGDAGARRRRSTRDLQRRRRAPDAWAASRPSSSVDDRDGAEWNTDALGPTKRGLRHRAGAQLRAEVRRRAASCTSARASGTRASSCRAGRCQLFWRADGQPLLARPGAVRRRARADDGATEADAQRFLAARWRSGSASTRQYVHPGLRGRLVLPVARAPAAGQRRPVRLAARRRAGARRACAACSRRGSTRWSATCCRSRATTAPASPGRAGSPGPGSCATTACYLIPGDSPMGYRLPLDSLPWAAPSDMPLPASRPTRPRRCRRCRRARRSATRRRLACDRREPRAGASASTDAAAARTTSRRRRRRARAPSSRRRRRRRPRRARRRARAARAAAVRVGRLRRRAPRSSAEPRDGRLYVFMPPLARARGLPRAASPRSRPRPRELRHAGRARRLPPPRDPRLKMLQVTPDPGVIEVNIHPAHNWGELVDHTEFLYDAALRDAPVDREVHARRPPHRHRRRQPLRARRRHAGRLARSCAGPTCWPA